MGSDEISRKEFLVCSGAAVAVVGAVAVAAASNTVQNFVRGLLGRERKVHKTPELDESNLEERIYGEFFLCYS